MKYKSSEENRSVFLLGEQNLSFEISKCNCFAHQCGKYFSLQPVLQAVLCDASLPLSIPFPIPIFVFVCLNSLSLYSGGEPPFSIPSVSKPHFQSLSLS